MATSGTTNESEWYNEWQRVTTNDNEWQQMTMNDSEWQQVAQRVTTNDNDWQRVTKSGTTSKKDTFTSKMDDCNSFFNENSDTTSRDGWLILEWLNRLPLKGWLQPLRSVSLIYGSLQALVKKWHYHRKNRW